MNPAIQTLLATIPETREFMQAVGGALTTEQQLFVSANLQQLAAFLRSDVGRVALQTFVDDWRASVPA